MSATSRRFIRVGLVQMECAVDPATNMERALAGIHEAADDRATVVCLPELFRSRYFCQVESYDHFDLAEKVPGPTTQLLEDVARNRDVVIIASLFEERAPGLYHNTAAVIDRDKGYVGKYRKMHIPDDPRYYEKFYFTPGDLGFKSFATSGGNLGVLICWDQWYPEAARLTAMRGADALFYPTAIGWHPEEKDALGDQQLEAWRIVQRAHAITNGCFVVAVNRTGFEPTDGEPPGSEKGIQFWGHSFVAGPDGAIIGEISGDEPGVVVVDLDLENIQIARTGWPFLRDRRIEAYADLSRRFIDAE
ncbi:MAG TPA: carbon-nitrogen hydrolase [Rhodothermales bacterium]|nr:carbon-nitrogen hydrolase [Rhodothermales bacterium]